MQKQIESVHLSEEQGSDFVRGLVPQDLRGLMEAHLQSGCTRCLALIAAFEAVAKLAALDRSQPVPHASVVQAEALFEQRPSSSWVENLHVIRGQFVPPIFSDWRLAGARSGVAELDQAGRRMLFRADGYTVDLKVDAPAGGENGEIIGQISRDDSSSDSLGGVLVQLVSGPGHTLGETTTNRFGEFFVDYSGQRNAVLRFALREWNHRLDLRLDQGPRQPEPGKRTRKREQGEQ